ncbi:MAG: sugar transferase [Candidatus Atribacteria bacterium]|nr:sugar transferase [Candidatus Atribacteria bacterium]
MNGHGRVFIKRIFDGLFSCIGLVLSSPLWLYVTAKIKREDGGPVFFIQERVGKEGKLFKMYKFRSMVVGAEKKGIGVFVSRDDQRITKIGRWIRRTSVDELPQLLNVLKGEMSMVGPRPTLEYQVKRYNERQKKRLLVKPGITGWAQINGRNTMTWPEKIELDVWYVEHWNLRLDWSIGYKTIRSVIKREGIYSDEGIIVDEISKIE